MPGEIEINSYSYFIYSNSYFIYSNIAAVKPDEIDPNMTKLNIQKFVEYHHVYDDTLLQQAVLWLHR